MKIKKLVNLTPHDIVVFLDHNQVIYRTEGVLRVSENRQFLTSTQEGVKIFRKSFGTSSELPEKEEGTMYIVSVPVAQAHGEREDLIIPDDIVRDTETGRIVGCKSFATLA